MKSKIHYSVVLLGILSAFMTIIFMSVAYNKWYETEVTEDIEQFAQYLSEFGILDESGFWQEISLQEKDDIRICILDSEGNVLQETTVPTEAEDHRKQSVIQVSVEMKNGNILVVSKGKYSLNEQLKVVLPITILILAVLFVISLILAYVFTVKLLRPIEELAGDIDENNGRLAYYEELEPFISRIRKQHEDLVKSAKVRQEFTANVTHELKTPLTSISGYAELIETGLASGEDTVRFASGIRKSANRLLVMINDIIRLSELDSKDEIFVTEPVNLYQLARVCVEMMEPNAEKLKVNLSVQGKNCRIKANRMMMEELLYNLCDNAIRYNNAHGNVLVNVYPSGDNVILIVSDNGIGIPKESHERIFERFFTVDKSRSKSTGGTGLGLAIVKHILEKHNAKVEVESEIGKGTAMKITFKKYE